MKKNQLISEIDLSDLVIGGNNAETVFLIGRSKECHIVLDEKKISREHSKIVHKNDQWRIDRLSLDTPLLLNNSPIESSVLHSGDNISIGPFTLELEKVEASVNPAPVISKPVVAQEIPVVKEVIQEEVEEVTSEFQDDGTSELNNETTGELKLDEFEMSGNDVQAPEMELQDLDSFATDSEASVESSLEMASDVASDSPSYSLENISNENTNEDGTQVLSNFATVTLELFGEFAPYDKFVLTATRTIIGRDPSKCQIVLNDPEVSSQHAVIIKNNMLITLEDLQSGNGTILNGERINKANLNQNDEFIIGSTSLKVKINSEFLKEEQSTLMPVDQDQTIEVEEVVEVEAEEGEHLNAFGEVSENAPVEKSIIKRIWKDEEKRKKLIYALVLVIGAWVMFGEEEAPVKPAASAKKEEKSKDAKDSKDSKDSKTDKTEIGLGANVKGTPKKLSLDEKRALSERYQIGKKHFQEGRYRDALDELQKIAAVDPHFNTSLLTLIASAKEGLSKLEEQEKKRKEEEAIAERKAKVKSLIEKATTYVNEHRAELAQDTFNDIAKLDPENIEVSRLKREIEDWVKEKQRKELEIAQKKKDREDRIEKMRPGKNLFLQKEWFRAAGKLEEFLRIKDMDEDLTKEASEMLKTSREELNSAVMPLIGKAKSLMEGQDLKGAYEVYQSILKIEPSNTEALNAMGEIKDTLTAKARKIYREAIISESLSLFQDAKEKFQEVQQVSPVDSDYYKKATDKLKDYLD